MKKFNLCLLTSTILVLTACGSGGSSNDNSKPVEQEKPIIQNHAPIAVAGNPQNITLGHLVYLDGGQSSDEDLDNLTYQWVIKSKPQQSTATLSNSTVVNPTFKPDLVGKYTIELKVNDGKLDSAISQVVIEVVKGNAAPVAVIASLPKEVNVGTKYILDGKQSTDSDNDKLTYQWTLDSKPTNSTAQLSQAQSSEPSIIFDEIGTYVVGLVVHDGQLSSNKVATTINIVRGNSEPVAIAGNGQKVEIGDTVTLDGSQSSDADGDKLTYQWAISSKPEDSRVILKNATSIKPSFVADVAGSYVLSLIVSDGITSSKPSNVTIAVEAKPELFLISQASSSWDNSSTTYKLPYSTTSNFQTSSSCVGNGCRNDIELANYTLVAQGQKFTIVDLKVTSSNTNYPAFFEGLNNNQVIQKDESVNFGLRLTKTQWNKVEVIYSFTVKETGQTFSYTATGSTN